MHENLLISVTYKEKCNYCSCITDKHAEQRCYVLPDGSWRIQWEAGYYCDCCDSAVNPADFDKTPKYARDALIKEHGLWMIDIGEPAENREDLLITFLKLGRRINFKVLKQLPPLRGTIAEGTFIEMKCLQLSFEDIGILSILSKKQ